MRGSHGVSEATFRIPESANLNERMSPDVSEMTDENSMDPEDYIDFMLGQSGGKRKTMKRKGGGKKHKSVRKSMKGKKHKGVKKTMKRKVGKK